MAQTNTPIINLQLFAGKKETPTFFANHLSKARADLHRAVKSQKNGLSPQSQEALKRADDFLEKYRKAVGVQETALQAKKALLDL